MTPLISFHTLTMNFILTLSKFNNDDYDVVMSITCKFIKRIICISEKTTWSAAQWAKALLNKFDIIDWRILKFIISNKNKKFMSKFWTKLFRKLKVKLLYFTVYHSQTNEQNERINQIIEIALQYAIVTLFNLVNWFDNLSQIQRKINNVNFNIIDKTLNEAAYDFISIQSLNLLKHFAILDLSAI